MANFATPTISVWGNSGATEPISDNLTEHKFRGQLDPDNLNKNTLQQTVEFNQFEETINSYVRAQLGEPVIRVELTPFQIKTCIDEALTRLDYHAPAWAKQYAVFDATQNVSLYEIPQWIARNLQYVVYKKSLLSIQSQAGTLEFDFFLKFFSDNYLFQNFGISDYYVLQMNMEMTRKILGQEGSWEVIGGKYLQLTPPPSTTDEKVILEYRGIDTDTIFPAWRNWAQRYALACAKVLLGNIRSKYAVLPGPAGGAQLNGAALVAEGREDKERLEDELALEIEGPPRWSTF
jgi:hypothetical protein